MNIIRKGQIRWLPKTDNVGQMSFTERAFWHRCIGPNAGASYRQALDQKRGQTLIPD